MKTVALFGESRYPAIRQMSASLNEFAYFERASAHVLAGWSPKIAELDVKLTLGQHLSEDMEHATLLRNRVSALSRLEKSKGRLPRGWRDVMLRIDRSEDIMQLLSGLYMVVKRRLTVAYKRYLKSTDPVSDMISIRLIRRIAAEKEMQVEWARTRLKTLRSRSKIQGSQRRIESLWNKRNSIGRISDDEAIWPPVDRVPRVARPNYLSRGEMGALRMIPDDPLRDPKGIGIFLHSFINEEFTTMELVCRNTYEHPDMPWTFHLDMARHAADEARHAGILMRAAAQFGIKYGDYPVYVSSYEAQYEFGPCTPGGTKELLWRLLLRQTFHEGLALDSIAFEIRKRKFLGQEELARAFEFLLADEVFHAQSGLGWSRYLCKSDRSAVLRERAAAHNYFLDRVKRGRAKFIAENPQKAVDEVNHLESIEKHHRSEGMRSLPFRRTLNMRARREAGFTDEEIKQVVEWGYVRYS